MIIIDLGQYCRIWPKTAISFGPWFPVTRFRRWYENSQKQRLSLFSRSSVRGFVHATTEQCGRPVPLCGEYIWPPGTPIVKSRGRHVRGGPSISCVCWVRVSPHLNRKRQSRKETPREDLAKV